MIDTSREPTRRELQVFGLLFALFSAIVGGLVYWKGGWRFGSAIIWGIALLVTVCYYALPSIRRALYRAWMALFFPIGWVVSHLILAIIYYLMFTPAAWVMRLFRRDSMQRKFDPDAATYWVEHSSPDDPSCYFRQS